MYPSKKTIDGVLEQSVLNAMCDEGKKGVLSMTE